MTAPELARLAVDLDTAREASRHLTAQWTQLVDAHRKARVAGREAEPTRPTTTEEARRG